MALNRSSFSMRYLNGFTLVEVMFALAIFGLGALAALHVATEQVRSSSILEERYFAQLVASNRMATVHAEIEWGAWPPQHEYSGDIELANRNWHFSQQVLETQDEDFREVTVRVHAQEGGPVLYEVSGFVGRR